ncbi:MAG: VCBS repeat-containing protein, partial [Caldilineaceae bacterium]|nr:VCBS repeat-containing protein [Caldilineaceae bacterium]
DLVDINADGLPDLVHTPKRGGHRFYLNRGHGRWQPSPVLPAHSPTDSLSSPNVRMADMNGDARVDLLVKAGSTSNAPFYYYTNRGDSEWELDGRVDFGPAPAFDLNDPNLQLIDVNNDHRIDVVLTVSGRIKIWLAREGAWSQTADFNVPAPAGDATRFSDPKIKVGDITGDRMEDLIYVRNGMVIYWPHNGNGNYDEGTIALNPPTGVGLQDVQIQVGDLNNDGLVDLVLPGYRTVEYWLSLGDGGFTDAFVLQNTPAFNARDTAVRLADIDGDGAVELLYSRYPAPANEAMQYVDFSTGPQPFLLASVDNGLGRTILIDYKSSIEDHIADWDAGTPWQVNLPFPVQVVRRVTVHDANSGDDYIIDYHYRDGYYDGMQKEFRGFVRSQEIKRGDETAATTVTNLMYDVGMESESRKGILLEKEVLGDGGHCAGDYVDCYQRVVNQLTTIKLFDEGKDRQVSYSYVSQSDSYIHEQQAQPVQLRQVFEQDRYGNVIKEFNYGQVCGTQERPDVTCGDDEILSYTEYIYQEESWLMNRPQRLYQTDAAGNFVSEARLYYDGEPFVGLPFGRIVRGDLTRQEENLGPNGDNRYLQTKRQQFDQYGNVIAMLDGNGNRADVEYGESTHTFPTLERLHIDAGHNLTFSASYDPGFGTVLSATDFNGQLHTFEYDTFGRISKIVQPGDTLEKPTEQFTYHFNSPRSWIKVEHREISGQDGVFTTLTYYDGLGRKLQMRSEGEDGKVVVSDAVAFDLRGQVRDHYLTYYAEPATWDYAPAKIDKPKTSTLYDPMGRAIKMINPDDTEVYTQYRPLAQEFYDEEDTNPASTHFDTPTTQHFDGLQRLVVVEERNGKETYTTSYAYDLLGNLTSITDAQGNIKRQTFDALGRKLSSDDPDRGHMAYIYDDAGNLLETMDAKEQH